MAGGRGADPVPEREVTVALPRGRLSVAVRGRGTDVLCLHGLTANRSSWRPLADRLGGRFRFVAPDLPGRGRSGPAPGGDYGLEAELARLEAVVERLVARPYLAVGHSQGAGLAASLASRPSGPAGMLLVNPVTPWTRRPIVLDLLRSGAVRRLAAPLLSRFRRPLARRILERRVYADPGRVTPATVRRYADPYRPPTRARALLAVLADWRPGDLADHLPRRPPPAIVLAGDRDRRVPVATARRLAERLDARLRVLEGAAHAIPEERTDEVADALEELAGPGAGRRTDDRNEPRDAPPHHGAQR